MADHDRPAAPFDVVAAYEAHGAALFRFAVNALGDRGAAEEAVQEVFARAWRSRGRYDARRAAARTWLFGIARNVVGEEYRRRRRRVRVVPLDGEGGGYPAGTGGARETVPGPEEAAVAHLSVVEAVARLRPEHRHVVVEVHLRGRSYGEVAADTGIAVATLRTRMFYGLRALRAHLEEVGWSDDAT